MGIQAKPFIERGNLVPDQVMLSLVMQRLQEPDVAARGYVLEGFPRTKEQAMAMQMKGILPTHFGTCFDMRCEVWKSLGDTNVLTISRFTLCNIYSSC
jgi:adenylate kinase family enzyme